MTSDPLPNALIAERLRAFADRIAGWPFAELKKLEGVGHYETECDDGTEGSGLVQLEAEFLDSFRESDRLVLHVHLAAYNCGRQFGLSLFLSERGVVVAESDLVEYVKGIPTKLTLPSV